MTQHATCAAGCTHDDGTPRLADSPSKVCVTCDRRTRRDLAELADLHEWLGDPMRGQRPREGGRSSERAQAISDEARQARSAIALVLADWCHTLNGKPFSVTLPAETVAAMAHVVAVNAGRLLGSVHADQLVHDVTTVAGDARRHLTPRQHRLTIGCPCGARVPLDPDADTITCPGCGEWGDLTWWRKRLGAHTDDQVPLTDLPGILLLQGINISLVTLRNWRARKIVAPLQDDDGDMRNERGHLLYDVTTTIMVVRHRELLQSSPRPAKNVQHHYAA